MADTITIPVTASGDNKPSTPATPQQTQANPPKPANDKPAEQQK